MKKILILLLMVTIGLCACTNGHPFKVGTLISEIDKESRLCFDMITLRVYQEDENYIIIVQDGYKVTKMVEFSCERKCLHSQNIDMIKNSEIMQYLDEPFRNVVETLGKPHADIGSGLYLPAYVTEDAYLIYFALDYEVDAYKNEDGIVARVVKKDIFTGKTIEMVRN